MDRWSFTLCWNFPTAMSLCSEIERKRLNRPGRRKPALPWNGDKVDFACASGEEGPVLQSPSALAVHASSSKKPSDARLRNQASVTEQDVRKRFICDLPVSFPYHNW